MTAHLLPSSDVIQAIVDMIVIKAFFFAQAITHMHTPQMSHILPLRMSTILLQL